MASRFQAKWSMLIIGIIVGVLVTWGFISLATAIPHGVTPYIVEGYSNGMNSDGTAIGVSEEVGGPGEGYVIAGAHWKEFDGSWHQGGTPPSLLWPNTGQRVRLGVAYVKPTRDNPGGPVVSWIEVLSD
jgi:hypothetical protein